MSFNIIVRKSGFSRHKGSPRFYKHFNRELCDKDHPNGQMMYTKDQYYSELKRRGLEPANPHMKESPRIKPIAMTDDTKQVIQSINEQTHQGKFTPSGRLLDKMASKGVKIRPTDADLKKLPSHYQEGAIGDDKN